MSVDVKGDEIESSVLQLQHLLQLDLGVVGPVALRSVVATCTRQVRSARPKRVDLGGGLAYRAILRLDRSALAPTDG